MTSNRYDGRLTFTGVDKDGENHELTLRYDVNALIELADHFEVDTPEEVASRLESLHSFKTLRKVLFIGLKSNHPNFTEEFVGSLQFDMMELGKKIAEAVIRAFDPTGNRLKNVTDAITKEDDTESGKKKGSKSRSMTGSESQQESESASVNS